MKRIDLDQPGPVNHKIEQPHEAKNEGRVQHGAMNEIIQNHQKGQARNSNIERIHFALSAIAR